MCSVWNCLWEHALKRFGINRKIMQAFFYWFWENPTFSAVGNNLANYLKLWKLLGKELLKENRNVLFFNSILLIIDILFSGAMISALQLYDWEKFFWIGKKTFNVALGMGPYFGPKRALEKRPVMVLYPSPRFLSSAAMPKRYCNGLIKSINQSSHFSYF